MFSAWTAFAGTNAVSVDKMKDSGSAMETSDSDEELRSLLPVKQKPQGQGTEPLLKVGQFYKYFG